MSSLRIYLLGNVRVLWKDEPLPRFSTHKTRSLFAYLVTHRQRAHPRARLAGLLWGDLPETRAHRNLNTTLWRLRHTLPADYLRVEEDTIAFNTASAYWLDVAVFEAVCAAPASPLTDRTRALEEAVRLYRGDFLEGWYEDWALVEAERLRLLYLRALHDLTDCYQAGGACTQALDCARRLLEIDPLREEAHYRVMELHAALGQREAALAQFVACQRILEQEVGIAPARETVALYEQIRSGTWAGLAVPRAVSVPPIITLPSAIRPAPSRTPFDEFGQIELVGRESETSFVRACLEALRANRGGMILLEGESGVGKTRLARETAKHATALSISTLWGMCPDLRSPPPYQGMVQALRSGIASLKRASRLPISPIWLSELTPLLPELSDEFPPLPPRSSSSTQERSRLLEAIAQFLIGCARTEPHLVILEDLQWADPATLEALRYVLPRLRDLPLLLMVTFRPEQLSDREDLTQTLLALQSLELTQRLELKCLSSDDTATLTRKALGLAEDYSVLTRFVHRETEGNPFFVAQVLKALVEEGYLHLQPDGRWEFVGQDDIPSTEFTLTKEGLRAGLPRVPHGIRQALQRRLATLAPSSRSVLEVAAVLGRDFDFDLLRHACGQSEEMILQATDDLLRRQLLIEENDRLDFHHDKIRQVVYSGLSRARGRALHRQAGQVLEKLAPQRVEELANHFYLAQEYASALPYCMQAGARASALYANQSALTYLGWAIESARHVGDERGWRALVIAHEQRGQVWDHLGNYDEALADFDSARQIATANGDLSGVARAIRRGGWVRGDHFGDWEYGLKQAQRAWELAQQAGDAREAAVALRDIAAFHNMRGEYAQALEAHRLASAGFRALGDVHGQASSLQYVAVTHHFLSQWDESLAAYRAALKLWQELGERHAAAKTQTNIGYLCLSRGELSTAEESFRQAEATLREIEAPSALAWTLIGLGALHRYRCRSQPCFDALAEASDIDQQTGTSPYIRSLIQLHRAMAQWHRGEVRDAFANLEESLALARQSGTPTLVVGVLNDLGRCLRQSGNVERAATLHQEAFALAQQIALPVGVISAQSELGLDGVIVGKTEEGRAHLEAALAWARDQTNWKRAEALLNLAEGCLVAGLLDQARHAAQECVALTDAMGLNEVGSWAYLIWGRAGIALGKYAEAETALRRGLECSDPAGQSLTRALLLQALDTTSQSPLRPGQARVKLARRDAPSGRPLRDDEHVTVTWTVNAGLPDETLLHEAGKVALRRVRILRLLQEAFDQGSEPTQSDLARALKVTVRTIRDDLVALRRQGKRVHTRGQ